VNSAAPEFLERKQQIEHGFIWKPHLYVGASYRPRYEELDLNQVETKAISWSNRLAEYSGGHVIMDCVCEYSSAEDIFHMHAVVLAERPERMPAVLAKSLWKEGNGSFRPYDPKEGGVIYNHAGHNDTYIINRIACPHNKGSCRRNKCPYQQNPSLAKR